MIFFCFFIQTLNWKFLHLNLGREHIREPILFLKVFIPTCLICSFVKFNALFCAIYFPICFNWPFYNSNEIQKLLTVLSMTLVRRNLLDLAERLFSLNSLSTELGVKESCEPTSVVKEAFVLHFQSFLPLMLRWRLMNTKSLW